MTPLPAPIGAGPVMGWRLCAREYADTWDSGEGAYLAGGRWNSPGLRVVYASLDPATAILEVAVHKGFAILDTQPHVLTGFTIHDAATIHVVRPGDIPNPNWRHPGYPSAGQQAFGDALLRRHRFVALPSAVSTHSWNLLFVANPAEPGYDGVLREPFALDTRLHPPRRRSP